MKMNNYEMEELLPLVAELTEKYTSKESTSISYEKARQLMEAVIYCIHQCEDDNQLISAEKLSAKDAYYLGREKLKEKVKRTQTAYNKMIVDFNSFGNENYNDTVTKGIPGFFQYYDIWFAPQETIITMDYPTICPIRGVTGIDAIEKYVEYISCEQRFMGALPEDYVCEILYRFQKSYKKQFYNVCSIILRHILGHMITGQKLGVFASKEDYVKMEEIIQAHDKVWLKKKLLNLLESLIQQKYEGNLSMQLYLKEDIEDYATEMYIAAQNKNLSKVVAL